MVRGVFALGKPVEGVRRRKSGIVVRGGIVGEYTETATTHPKQPKKLGGLKFSLSLLMFPFWYPKNVVCAPESEEGGK